MNENDFLSPGNIVQLGYEPNRIDLIVELEQADFEECYTRRMDLAVENTMVHFLSLDDLIFAKKVAGRLQDLADAEQLEKIRAREKKKS